MNLSTESRVLTVENGGQRIDLWLADNLTDLSRSRIQKLIAEGQVMINDIVCPHKKIILKKCDRITVTIPPVTPSKLTPESIPLDILYEDEYLLIINKPANFVVHPAPGHSQGTLVHALLAHCPDLKGIGGVERPGIVHRLDKDTTGAMVIAKTEIVLQDLQQQIKAKTAQREYLGIVYGSPKQDYGTINLPLGRHPQHRKKIAVIPEEKGGKPAVTHWQIKERLGNYSLIHYSLETGRTHQIRVHSNSIGHPILGDPLYSSGKPLGVNLTGQVLHAFRLTLTHPITKETISAIAPLPLEWKKLLRILGSKISNEQLIIN